MRGRSVRVSVSGLAVLAIAAGGVLGGANAAQGQSSDPVGGSSEVCGGGMTGGLGDWFQDPRPCEERPIFAAVLDGELRGILRGARSYSPGDEAVFETELYAFALPNGGLHPSRPDTAVDTVTLRTPHGFEFTGGEVATFTKDAGGFVDATSRAPLDATFTVDPVTGDVTATAPPSGWVIPSTERDGGFSSGEVRVRLTYRPTHYLVDGGVSFGFTGTGVPTTKWSGEDWVDVVPDLGLSGGQGSSGS